MSIGEFSVRATALAAFMLWTIPVREYLLGKPAHVRSGMRWCWLAGAGVMLIHVFLSFHVHHEWSHRSAVMETARQTQELTGLDWGGGVWVNYAFVLVWLVDALWQFIRPQQYLHRPHSVGIGVHTFLGFVWFNATVVFGSLFFQVIGFFVFILLGGILGRRFLSH